MIITFASNTFLARKIYPVQVFVVLNGSNRGQGSRKSVGRTGVIAPAIDFTLHQIWHRPPTHVIDAAADVITSCHDLAGLPSPDLPSAGPVPRSLPWSLLTMAQLHLRPDRQSRSTRRRIP